MAGYDPNRPRPTDGPRLVGLPGDPVDAGDAAVAPATPEAPEAEPAPDPTRRVLPRAAPPLDRRLPPAAFAGALGALVVLLIVWRRTRR